MKTKDHILAEIRRTAGANDGVPLGMERFFAETGIKRADWLGKHWARWGDALEEAGFPANQLTVARSKDDVLGKLAQFVKELGRFPVDSEMRLQARKQPGFPSHTTLYRSGGKPVLVRRLRDYCAERGQPEVVAICDDVISSVGVASANEADERGGAGYVYLVKHGSRREYKIGRTNNPMRREGEIRTELPEQLLPVHTIETDDPAGIEAYWHARFKEKRKNGEWFALDAGDVRAFKRWQNIY